MAINQFNILFHFKWQRRRYGEVWKVKTLISYPFFNFWNHSQSILSKSFIYRYCFNFSFVETSKYIFFKAKKIATQNLNKNNEFWRREGRGKNLIHISRAGKKFLHKYFTKPSYTLLIPQAPYLRNNTFKTLQNITS